MKIETNVTTEYEKNKISHFYILAKDYYCSTQEECPFIYGFVNSVSYDIDPELNDNIKKGTF